MIMAPMITAALFSSRPNVAIALEPSVSATDELLRRASSASAELSSRLAAAVTRGKCRLRREGSDLQTSFPVSRSTMKNHPTLPASPAVACSLFAPASTTFAADTDREPMRRGSWEEVRISA